eukprot:scpid84864/ scgid6692/ CUB and sushi domain-containing protein 1; CUB and sushi multiple domains protein 1
MKLSEGFLGLLCVSVVLWNGCNAKPHVETFNCNVATGMHLISQNRWANTSESSVHTTCASVGYKVITRVEAEGTCVQAFVNHIGDRVGSSTVIWVDNGTSISCYKNTTGPCPTLATPVCKRTGTIAAPGSTSCPRFQGNFLPNGMLTYPSGTTFPSQALIDCNPGYYSSGLPLLNCNPDGSWFGILLCQAYDCKSSLAIPHGKILGTSPLFTASCNLGYKLVGDPRITCTSAIGSTKVPSCSQMFYCALSTVIQNGTVSGSSPLFTVSCERGFKLVGDAQVICTSNTTTTCVPQCLQITCGAPLTPVNGLTTVHSLTTFSKAYYICKAGFVAVGDTSTTCEADGSWSGRPPICVQIQCPQLAAPNNGTIETNSHSVFGVSEFRCGEGYSLLGKSSAVCMSD